MLGEVDRIGVGRCIAWCLSAIAERYSPTHERLNLSWDSFP